MTNSAEMSLLDITSGPQFKVWSWFGFEIVNCRNGGCSRHPRGTLGGLFYIFKKDLMEAIGRGLDVHKGNSNF